MMMMLLLLLLLLLRLLLRLMMLLLLLLVMLLRGTRGHYHWRWNLPDGSRGLRDPPAHRLSIETRQPCGLCFRLASGR
jgi:hypothetical protein